jgi:hypothetical protein
MSSNTVITDNNTTVEGDIIINEIKSTDPSIININNNPLTDNNWNDTNEETLRGWKSSLIQYIFVYQYVLDKAQRHWDRTLVVVEVLGAIGFILSSITALILGIGKVGGTIPIINVTVAVSTETSNIINIVAIVLTATVAIINGLMILLNRLIKIYKWDSTVVECTAYISKMDKLCSIMAVELSLPRCARNDFNKFIKDVSVDFSILIGSSPNVDINAQKQAMTKYDEFVQGKINSFNTAQKYAKYGDHNISII